MAVLRFTDDAGVLRTLRPDCTIRGQHELTAIATRRPVERGGDLTDNVKAEPDGYTAELNFTNTPIEIPDGISGGFASLRLERKFKELTKTAKVSGGPGVKIQVSLVEVEFGGRPVEVEPAEYADRTEDASVQSLQFNQDFDRVRDAYDLLKRLRDKATLITIETKVKTLGNMVITRVSLPEEAHDAGTFTCEFLQVRVTTTAQIDVVPVSEKRAEKKKAQGAQSGYELPPEQESLANTLGLGGQ